MYNRYVFDPDGSCRKDQVEEPVTDQPDLQSPRQDAPEEPVRQVCLSHFETQKQNPLDFLKRMLPKGFDTGDLIVILLLLLMAGDSREDRNNALLTIALYFIL